jgi:hypothetical protein
MKKNFVGLVIIAFMFSVVSVPAVYARGPGKGRSGGSPSGWEKGTKGGWQQGDTPRGLDQEDDKQPKQDRERIREQEQVREQEQKMKKKGPEAVER